MNYNERMIKKIEEIRKKQVVNILAIESSCDETSVAIVQNGRTVLSNIISSQIEIHKRFGGVVPEVASRNHILAINSILKEALEKANMTFEDIDAIAVTEGAGLVGALLVGVTCAKALSFILDKPLIAVNHIKGHIAANYIAHKDLTPPFICIIASGGHTAVVEVTDYNSLSLLGTTQDDAIGEAFDKVARVLGLEYPGGVKIDRLAKGVIPTITFVKHFSQENSFDISYSGLKTAVINYVHTKKQNGEELDIKDICASFQKEAVDMLTQKAIFACKQKNHKTLVLAGGVSANSYLRESLSNMGEKEGIKVLYPPLDLCTDNAAMIGALAYFVLQKQNPAPLDLTAKANLPLE